MEAPDRKRLKPTYKPSPAVAPLPSGWTEHTAPTGHKYYYNTETKTSTYTRPVAAPTPTPTPPQPAQPAFSPPPAAYPAASSAAQYNAYPPNAQYNPYPQYNQPSAFSAPQQEPPRRRPQPHDRPKRKEVIPNCQPWLLVYTKLGRRFVHNPDTGESFWKFPQHVMKAVVAFDRIKLDEKLAKPPQATGANQTPITEHAPRNPSEKPQEDAKAHDQDKPQDEAAEDSSEYEEIEVTDDEDEEGAQREDADAGEEGPVEFNEDDIAWQLAAMEQNYADDQEGYTGEGDYEEGVEALAEEDNVALFCDMLEDLRISPYTPWDTLIEDGRMIDDNRYTVLPTTKRRKEVWSDWTRAKIAELKAKREKTEKQDPRIPYLALLSDKATPKLYWPEFRRKYKKEDAMRDAKFADKDREKLYREHIARLKLPSSQLKSDLAALLKSLPLRSLNRDTSLDALPKELLTDIRYISLPPKTRDALIEAHISTLAPAPDDAEAATEEQRAEQEKQAQERRRREQALREREQKVEDEKRKRERELRIGMGKLREGERELERAMKVGREGLRAQLDGQSKDE